jgi:hypothetical protein
VLDNVTRPEVLREILPPSDFELHGFTVIQAVDVTESEVMSALERDLIDRESIISQAGFLRVQERLRTFFGRPKMVATLSAIQGDQVFLINSGCDLTRNCIFADSRHLPISKFEGTPYERAIQNSEVLHIPDVLDEPSFKHKKEEMHEHGVRSLLIAPLHYQGECIGTLDLGSPKPGDLGPMDGLLMHPIQPLFSVAIKRALEDSNNRVQGVIKEKCTAIHPTVEWRFRHAAIHYLENLQKEGDAEIEAIVFKDVFPLYGISDVRGSSDERNRAIKEDLMEQLKLGQKVLELAHEERPVPILRELGTRVEGHIQRLLSGLGSGDEVAVGKFLKEDVESIFDHLAEFGLKVSRAVEVYQTAIDPNVGTIYKRRRHFEDSVSKLTHRLASVLDEKEAGAQAIFPHYYERHRTDGVDYLIYMGDSLLENGGFHELYLKDLRLWQLKLACALAVETERLKTSLKIPLETAHLILVQNTPLSIRFRFDEKRFDVDGAYDIRHEIIKSRLDKAMVKGRRERLTQPGKIAIVYSHPDEGIEMRRHIDYLRSEGLLTDELERLDLEDLPGVQGLKSFRVGVNLDVQAHSQSVEGAA